MVANLNSVHSICFALKKYRAVLLKMLEAEGPGT
jgi:hypothetical protein